MRKEFAEKGFEHEMLSLEKRAELLEKSFLAKGLEWSEIQTLSGYLEPYYVHTDCIICNQGEQGDFMCMVYKGRVDVIKKDIHQVEKVIASLGPGNVIGEMSLIDGEPRSAMVIVHTPVILLVLTRDNFDVLAEAHPRLWGKVIIRVARVLSKRLRQTSGILAEYLSE